MLFRSLLGRPRSSVNSVAVAAVSLLLFSPHLFWNVGWRLSVLAALLIAAVLEEGSLRGTAFWIVLSPSIWLISFPQTSYTTSQEVLSEIRRLSPLFTSAGLDAYPRQISALVERLNAGEILADVFRDGFLTEYTWPELEAASAELGTNTTFHEAFPAIGVAADGHIIWVDGDKRIAEALTRSEERRVGKECRSRWSPYH